MDFLHRLKEHMEGLTSTPSTIRVGSHTHETPSVAIKPSPSNIRDRDLSKGKEYPFSFQLLVHDTNHYTAYNLIMDLFNEYDGINISSIVSSDNSFALTNIACTTLPNHVEDTNKGTLYTAMFEAQLYIQGGN